MAGTEARLRKPAQESGAPGEGPSMDISRRRGILKRGAVEVGIGTAFHLLMLCAYLYIHVYDASVVKTAKDKGFPGLLTYGGRWKYLTYINLVRDSPHCSSRAMPGAPSHSKWIINSCQDQPLPVR